MITINSREPRYPINMAVIKEPDRLGDWLPRLKSGTLAVDTETTGLRWDTERVGGLCLAAGETSVYICKNALGNGVRWLADQVKSQRELVFHNAKFDLHHLRYTFGLRVPYIVHDTMIESFLIDNRGAPFFTGSFHGSHGLKNLAAYYVDPAAKEPEDQLYRAVVEAGGNKGKEKWKGDLLMAPDDIVGTYGLMDTWYTLLLHQTFQDRIKGWVQPGNYPSLSSLYETERWVLSALVEMEQLGILVEPTFFEAWKQDLEKQVAGLERDMTEIAGTTINWNSAPQLRELLYKRLGIPIKRYTTPKKGSRSEPQPSTDEVALLDINHPIAPLLLRYRDATKQLGTYARGLLNAVWTDGRIHANFKQTGARTGRLSCEDPNLQQVPRESGARRGFIADPNLELRFADYSQVEMRFAAHLSRDPTLMKGFRFDPKFDTHAATAMKMWGLLHAPTSQQRKFAKIMNFAMLYGAGENKITSQLVSLLSLKEAKHAIRSFGHRPRGDEAPHRTLAKLLLERYFTEFPSIKDGRSSATDEAERYGYTTNEFGRRRYLEESESYKAFNSRIQGSAADLAKRGLADVYREFQHSSGQIAILLQIHDEIVYLSDGDPKIDRQILEVLNEPKKFRVPIVADISGSKTTWQDKVDLMKLVA